LPWIDLPPAEGHNVNRFRTSARMTAAAGVLSAGVLAFAAPATAASSDSVTIDNHANLTIRTSHVLHVASTAQATCQGVVGGLSGASRTVSLTLAGPTGPDPATNTFKTTSKPCNQQVSLDAKIGAPKLNGSYTLTLQNGSSSRTTNATLNVLIPPARTKGLAVTTAGTIATFTWAANSEADVRSYQLLNSAGAVVSSVSAADACKGGASCSTRVDLGSAAAGHSEKFRVRAVRCALSCSGKGVVGPSSSAATATFAAGAAPSPRTTPAGPGGTGGTGSGGTGSTGTASTSGSGGSGGGGSSTANAGTGGKLPGTPHVLAKRGGKIHHPTSTIASKKPTSTTHAIAHDSSNGGTFSLLWRGIAAAAVLLLIAVHLRAWRTRTDLA
jgi:hypothetical protein